MNVFPIGIIWFILLIISCFCNIKYTAMLVLISFVLQGASVLELPILLLKVYELSSVVLIFRFLAVILEKRKIRISKSVKWLYIFVVFTIVVTVFSGIIFHGLSFPQYSVTRARVLLTVGRNYITLNRDSIGPLLRLMLLATVFMIMTNLKSFASLSEKDIEITLKISIWIITIVGIAQLLNTFKIINTDVLVRLFHYERVTDERMTDSYFRGSMQLYSTFMEASYLAQWSVSVMAYISFAKEWKHRKVYLGILVIELALSFSATGVIGLIFFIMYSAIKRAKKGISLRWIVQYMGIALFASAFLFLIPYGQRILEMVSTKLVTESGIERIAYIKLCLDAFEKSLGIGVGFLKVQSMSLFTGLLGQVGLLGAFLFLKFIFSLYKDKNIETPYKAMLIAIIVCNCISCPGLLGHLPLWCILDYIALSSGKEKQKVKIG